MPYCKNCGTKYEHRTKFCEQCGSRLNGIVSEDHIGMPSTPVNIDNNIESTSKLSNDIKSNLISMKFKFKNKKLIFIVSFMIFLLVSITIYNMFFNNKIISVPIEKLNQLKIIDYFPHEIGSSFNYLMASNINSKDVIKDVPDSDINYSHKIDIETYSDLLNGKLLKDCFYGIDQDSIKTYHSATALGISNNISIILSKKLKWERNNNTTCYITGINMSVTTKSEIFNNCIEVTVVEHSSNDIKSYFYTKEYYAPKVGLVQIKSKGMNSSNLPYTVFEELISYNIPEQSQQSNATINSSSNDNAITSSNYINKAYNFTLDIPKEWDKKYIVEDGNWATDAEKTFDFSLIVNRKNYGNIFSIIILKKGYSEDYIKNTPYQYIATNNGHVIAYSIPSEPSTDQLNNPSILNTISKMVSDDVPQIIKSIKFQ